MSDYQAEFERGMQALIDHFVGQATQKCRDQLEEMARQYEALQRRWPIVGTEDVRTIRQVAHNQVIHWIQESLPDLDLTRLERLGRPGVERYWAARYAAHNVLYRGIEHEFSIPEVKALPQSEVTAAVRFIRHQPVPVAAIWRAVVKKAIHQRVEFWVRRGLVADTASVRQGAIQHLWWLVRTSGFDGTQSEVARRRILRLVDRAAVPGRSTPPQGRPAQNTTPPRPAGA